MNTKFQGSKRPAEHVVKGIRRATWRHFPSEDKIRIVLEDLRDEDNTAELCRKKGIAQSLYSIWSNRFPFAILWVWRPASVGWLVVEGARLSS